MRTDEKQGEDEWDFFACSLPLWHLLGLIYLNVFNYKFMKLHNM